MASRPRPADTAADELPLEEAVERLTQGVGDEPEGMSDDELVAFLTGQEQAAIGYFNDQISTDQARALDYYMGVMGDLTVPEGCSSVVDYVVAVMVDNAMAACLKPFVSSDEMVVFEPRGPEDVEAAEQATDYVNYVIQCDNPGFMIFHDWFKDAFLSKLGVVKAWWEDTTTTSVEKVPMGPAQLLRARGEEGYLGEEEMPAQALLAALGGGAGMPGMPQLPGQPPATDDVSMYLAHMQKVEEDGRIRIMNVPPEEFLISANARSIETAPYCAHKPGNFTRSDLIEFGVDAEVVESLPADASRDVADAREMARRRDESAVVGGTIGISGDRSQDVLALLDEYVRVDYDGDGVAEMRRVVRVGDVILLNEVVEDNPFATLCPVPMPHKVYGLSIADQAMEGQKVQTVITRQTLDNLYKSNNPRPIVPEQTIGKMTWDDLMSTSPGAAIRTKGPIEWLAVPFTSDKSFAMMEAIARGVEERTGIQRVGLGFSSEALEKNSPDTATQAAIDENARTERVEMIARIFAETGVKRLFKLVLKLLVAHQPKSRIVRLRNKFVEMDPSGWYPEMDVSISVGLGIGNKAEQIGQANAVLESMERLAATPYASLIDETNVRNALKRLYTATGIKNVDDYLQPPEEPQIDPQTGQPVPKQPPPDPAAIEAQGKMQAEMAKVQAKAQADQQKAQSDAQVQALKIQQQGQLEQMRIAQAAQDAQNRQQLEQQKAMFEAQLAQTKSDFEQRLALAESQAEIRLERLKLEQQREMGRAKIDADVEIKQNRPGGDLSK